MSEITSDAAPCSLHINSKSSESCEVEFIIAISKNPEPPSKN